MAAKKHSSPRATHTRHASHAVHHSFWFRLWLGFLIGANVAFIGLAALGLILGQRAIPFVDSIIFIIIGAVDIFFMVQILRWKRYAVYGTIAMTACSILLNFKWGADIFFNLLYGILPLAITLWFVFREWNSYR